MYTYVTYDTLVHHPQSSFALQAFFTLFQIVTLDSWTGISRPLGETSPLAGIIIVPQHRNGTRMAHFKKNIALGCFQVLLQVLSVW